MELQFQKIVKNNNEEEFILFKVEEDCNLWPFVLLDATYDYNGESSNKHRHSFLFPNQNVKSGDFVLIYTSEGKKHHFRNKAGSTTWVFYWDLDVRVWNQRGDEALLLKISEFKRLYY